MAQALPVHIIREIERRWQRRMDERPQVKPDKIDDLSVWLCSRCNTPAPAEPAILWNAVPRRGYVCSGCGFAWGNEAL
jgi:hypothetical protein